VNSVIHQVRGLANLSFLDMQPRIVSLQTCVFEGLRTEPYRIASKFLYDKLGSELFDAICKQPEYYQTNAELDILERFGDRLIDRGGKTLLVELGSGHSRKIRLLLQHLRPGDAYVPVDISSDYLLDHATKIAQDFPHLQVAALCADFLLPLRMPVATTDFTQCIVFFPGSTLGNFEPKTQRRILANCVEVAGIKGKVIIGMDQKNDKVVLNAAYNDKAGATAAFELNLLRRINRELGTNFDLTGFAYVGFYNESAGRVEMYLECRRAQTVTSSGGHIFPFAVGTRIHVENSYKYDAKEFISLCREEGLKIADRWTDKRELFNVYKFVLTPA
jgi:dimethylhistidine N-methyltransferase